MLSSQHRHEHWCLSAVGGEFVAAMEDVLDLYEEPSDAQYPTVCLDEKPVVLHADVQPSVPVEPGHPERVDYEYERRGTRNLFVMVEPRAGLAARGSHRATYHARLRQSRALACR